MAERGVDPLGKRALFWAPGPDPGPPRPRAGDGARSAASAATRSAAAATARSRRGAGSAAQTVPSTRPSTRAQQTTRARTGGLATLPSSSGTDLGKRALYSRPADPRPEPADGADETAGGGSPPPTSLNAVHMRCATCGSRTTVGVLRFLRLHLPVFVWRPGRGFARFMTCPACGRRAWVSASWPAPPAG